MSPAAVLVTGGAGFVGARLALGLRERLAPSRVVALDNLKRRGSELNLVRLREGGVEFVHGDIRNAEDLEAVGPIDLLVECSAEPSVLAGFDGSPRYLVDTNLAGTVNCLEFARKRGAGVIFLSTSRVYPHGALGRLPLLEEPTRFAPEPDIALQGVSPSGISEGFPLEGPRSLYGATKLCSELILQEYADMYGLRTVVNRCGLIAGPWQMGKVDQGVVVLWAARHIYGGRLAYIGYGGRGKQVRDMLHVDDLLDLILYEALHLDVLNGGVFNVGGGLEISASLMELTAVCREIAGNCVDIASELAERPADVPWYVTDNARITQATGWAPKRNVRAILEDICRWIDGHREALRPILAQS